MYTKGILAKVDLLKAEIVRQEAEQNLLQLHYAYVSTQLSLNQLLHQHAETDLKVESLPDVMHKYDNFAHWLTINLQNYGVSSDIIRQYENNENLVLFNAEEDLVLRNIYVRIGDKKKELTILESIITKTSKIVEFQKLRFKNSRATNADVMEALQHLTEVRMKRIMLMYEYVLATAESHYFFTTHFTPEESVELLRQDH
jgi:outer membrane protein TolC